MAASERAPRTAAGGAAGPITGAILAGGAATRFGGQAKGLLRVGTDRILDRVVAALRPVVDDLLLVANAPDAESWVPGVRVVRDRVAVRASIVGVHSALSAAGTDVAVLGWDMPFVPSSLMAHLVTRRQPGVDAIVPEGPDGPEPLAAVYAHSALPTIDALIAREEFTLTKALRALGRVVVVPADEVARVASADLRHVFANVNTPEDLAMILSRAVVDS